MPSLSLTPGLAALYRQVERVPVAALDDAAAHGTLPFASGTFDLVTLYGHCPPRIALIELRRVLSRQWHAAAGRGQWLVERALAWWVRTLPGRPANLSVLKSLRRAGFAKVSGYWVEPSLAIPRNLIPVARGRARQFEAIRAREWGGGTFDWHSSARAWRPCCTRHFWWSHAHRSPAPMASHKMDRHSLLSRINEELGGGPRAWSDVVLVRNVGPLQTSVPLAGDRISNRGFNAIVFTPGGGPSHFLKVRPLTHGGFAREAGVTVQLSAQEDVASLVPRSRTFIAGPARILAQEFIEGVALDVLIRSRQARAWHALAADVLRSTVPLREAIGALSGETHANCVQLPSVREDLDLLASLGLNAVATRELAARLDAVALATRPQHGDFWPRNVLKPAGGWRVLDFESCGEEATPLYDVFHLIRGCGEAAGGGRGDWLERWIEAGATRGRCRMKFDRPRAASNLTPSRLRWWRTRSSSRPLHRRGIAPSASLCT